jgi:hypothetical protein
VAKILAEAPGSRVTRVATPLTQETRRAAQEWKRAHKDHPKREVPRIGVPRYRCKACGKALSNKDRTFCNACLPGFEERQHKVLVEHGQKTLARLRAEGNDPAHGATPPASEGRPSPGGGEISGSGSGSTTSDLTPSCSLQRSSRSSRGLRQTQWPGPQVCQRATAR